MGQWHMLPHPLKAWSLDEWGMPTASTGASTSSGADYCWWLRARWVTLWCSNVALRSVGCPAPPLGCLRDHFSLILSPSTATPPGKKKEHSTGLFKNSEAWTQATWLKSPFWFKQSLANFSSGLDAVVFIHWLWVVLQLLAGNCLPYHQPNCPTTDKPTKVLEPTWFLLAFRGRRFCLHAFPGGPTTDHPCSLPASPEASDADDVVRRCPPQGMQTNSEYSTIFPVTPCA